MKDIFEVYPHISKKSDTKIYRSCRYMRIKKIKCPSSIITDTNNKLLTITMDHNKACKKNQSDLIYKNNKDSNTDNVFNNTELMIYGFDKSFIKKLIEEGEKNKQFLNKKRK